MRRKCAEDASKMRHEKNHKCEKMRRFASKIRRLFFDSVRPRFLTTHKYIEEGSVLQLKRLPVAKREISPGAAPGSRLPDAGPDPKRRRARSSPPRTRSTHQQHVVPEGAELLRLTGEKDVPFAGSSLPNRHRERDRASVPEVGKSSSPSNRSSVGGGRGGRAFSHGASVQRLPVLNQPAHQSTGAAGPSSRDVSNIFQASTPVSNFSKDRAAGASSVKDARLIDLSTAPPVWCAARMKHDLTERDLAGVPSSGVTKEDLIRKKHGVNITDKFVKVMNLSLGNKNTITTYQIDPKSIPTTNPFPKRLSDHERKKIEANVNGMAKEKCRELAQNPEKFDLYAAEHSMNTKFRISMPCN